MQTEVVRSRLTSLLFGRFEDWARSLEREQGLIVAIARKGPRLLELLVRDRILSPTVLDRVVSEFALPFLRTRPEKIVITDDAVAYGSTFHRVFCLAEAIAKKRGWNCEVVGKPFAVGDKLSASYKQLSSHGFHHLRPEDVAGFVNNEVLAFRLLGKPIGLEHPILTLSGEFANPTTLESVLERVAQRLKGRLIPIVSPVPTAQGMIESRTWTIIFDLPREDVVSPDFCKLRVFVTPEGDLLRVVAMAPFAFPQDELARFGQVLPESLRHLWGQVASRATREDCSSEILGNARQYGLTAWANFLAALSLLAYAQPHLAEECASVGWDVAWLGPRQADLRLLVGGTLASEMETPLATYLQKGPADDGIWLFKAHAPEIQQEEKIPEQYRAAYQQEYQRLRGRAQDVGEVMAAIFHAQHRAIEVPSRDDRPDAKDRLEFGVTFGKLLRDVREVVPDAKLETVHRWLDRLIDDGCVVPRYINLGQADTPLWARTFRVGEGPIMKVGQTVRLLTETLQMILCGEEREKTRATPQPLPALLLQTFAVLTLLVARDNPNLAAIRLAEFSKGFGPSDAFCRVCTGQSQEPLLSLALRQRLLLPETEKLRLGPDVIDLFPPEERHWDDLSEDAVQDLARLACLLHQKPDLGPHAFTLLTTVASRKEYGQATDALLAHWLHDSERCIYKAVLGVTRALRVGGGATGELLGDARAAVARTHSLFERLDTVRYVHEHREDILTSIQQTAKDAEELVRRIWREMQRSLQGRLQAEEGSSGQEQIDESLLIARTATNLLRDFIAVVVGEAQAEDRWTDAVADFSRWLTQEVSHATRAMFAARDKQQAAASLLASMKENADPASRFVRLRAFLHLVASRCTDILRDFGSAEYREHYVVLDPPQFLLMWDVRGSTQQENRDIIEGLIGQANTRIRSTLGTRAINFDSGSKDDGNGLICKSFEDVLAVFDLLRASLKPHTFRAGCEVNIQGRLHYYPQTQKLGGRAYEHAARIAALFKEIQTKPECWRDAAPPTEPTAGYLVVAEFARRYAEDHGKWPSDSAYNQTQPPGRFRPRVFAAMPISVTILVAR